jgi:RES domain-containing protein
LALPPGLPRLHFSGTVFRVVREGLDPLATSGSLRSGGRFNTQSEFGALYTSLDGATAVAEVARGLQLRGINVREYPEGAYWMYELEVTLNAVLDVYDALISESIGLLQDSLTGTDVAITRRIAADARSQGFEALLVPSAAVGGAKNLVIFLDKISSMPDVISSTPVNFGRQAP